MPPLTAERTTLLAAYGRNRERSAFLFDLPDAEAYTEAPIPLRLPFVFYEGHIPAFSLITLIRSALCGKSVDESFERLFRRGIDPDTVSEARRSAPTTWPGRTAVRAFASACDERIVDALRNADIDNPENPHLLRAQAIHVCLEHEQMHHETLLYILHHLPPARKRRLVQTHEDSTQPPYERVRVETGEATLGAARDEIPFGWDNEFEKTRVRVNAFTMERNSVTNCDYLHFLEKIGADTPPFWRKRRGTWHLLTQFDLLPLPLSWPVYVTQAQASAYAAWKGMRLPTEAEYHRAAFGAPEGGERSFPWGEEQPDATRGNFDMRRYDPVPVGSYPLGASAWGVNDFTPMITYPVYSADFFDGKHYVLKGASPVTDRQIIRRTFRNWFRADYPYLYAKFRCVM
jgi:formylglycine-generating enzyme required for sulfatase activity